MAYIDTDNGETKKLLTEVREARKNLETATCEFDKNEPSMYIYCKKHDAVIRAVKRLEEAYASLGNWLYPSL